MKRKVSVFTLTLLLVCMLPIALNIPSVQADVGGEGKYLEIRLVGEGYVTATKVKSGETWIFTENRTEKVGAGIVLLEAFAFADWEFSHWEGDLDGISENATEYKTVKYGLVVAVFVIETNIITASSEGNGTIVPSGAVPVAYGANQTFEFVPDAGYHVSAIIVDSPTADSPYQDYYAENYTFYNVTTDHTIHVIFSLDGEAFVPPGSGQTVFPAAGVILTFNITDGGWATAEEAYHPVEGLAGWDIGIPFPITGGVIIGIHYDDTNMTLAEELSLRLILCESELDVLSDVDGDLDVDGTDVSIVANAVKQGYWYDPILDLNNDGFVNEYDLSIVNEHKGAILVDVTLWVDTLLNIVYGINYVWSPWFFFVH